MLHEYNDNKTEQYFFQILMGKPMIRALLVEIFQIVYPGDAYVSEGTKRKIGLLEGIFWKSLSPYRILEGLDNEARSEIMELLFGTGVQTLSDLDKRINALKSDASRLWDEDIRVRGVVFDLVFKVIEKMFDIDDSRFLEYTSSQEVHDDEDEAIQMVSDLLDIFGIQMKKPLLAYRKAFEKNQKEKTFFETEEKQEFYNEITLLSDQIFQQKMGNYIGKK